MRVVILVPRKEDGGGRDRIWNFVKPEFWEEHFPKWEIFEGYDDEAPVFSMARARNNAARAAGDWDVAVIADADTIANPSAVFYAVKFASESRKLWSAGDMRMRMDLRSSERYMAGIPTIPRPEGDVHPKRNVIQDMVYGEPSSGVLAIGRPLWEATGGYMENLLGWGWEDLVFITQCCVVGDGMDWVRNEMIAHLYHDRTPEDHNTKRNYRLWKEFHDTACRSNEQAKAFLVSKGHRWTW